LVSVLITRPAQDAQRWMRGLSAQGLQAIALPLIAITPAANPLPVQQAWQRWADYQAAMFVSGNAAHHFFALNQPLAHDSYAPVATNTRAWATGPGTVAALQQRGLARTHIDAPDAAAGQFDSEALWHIVAPQVRPGSRILVVRGSDHTGAAAGRSWLAEQLAAAGAQLDTVVAYERRVPVWTAAQVAQAQQACSDGSVWLFSSSEAIQHLRSLLPGQDFRAARAVATHARIAQAARTAGFGVVCESLPLLERIVASIESLA
jgi:uroporphyrinogen-III synthase